MVVFIQCAMQWDAVGLEQEILKENEANEKFVQMRKQRIGSTYLEGVNALQTERLFNAIRQVGVVKYNNETKSFCSQCHSTTDTTWEKRVPMISKIPKLRLSLTLPSYPVRRCLGCPLWSWRNRMRRPWAVLGLWSFYLLWPCLPASRSDDRGWEWDTLLCRLLPQPHSQEHCKQQCPAHQRPVKHKVSIICFKS